MEDVLSESIDDLPHEYVEPTPTHVEIDESLLVDADYHFMKLHEVKYSKDGGKVKFDTLDSLIIRWAEIVNTPPIENKPLDELNV